MASDGRISNVLGVPLPQWIVKQLDKRSKELSVSDKTNDNVIFRANRSSWVRMVSSIDVITPQIPTYFFGPSAGINQVSLPNPVINYFFNNYGISIKDKSDLAKQFVLQGGVSKYEQIDKNKFKYTPSTGLNETYGIGGQTAIHEYGYRPMPGITSVRVQTQGKLGSIRSAEIQLKVWDKVQLDIIDTLYFKLGYTMFLEWGHTCFYKDGSTKLEWAEDYSVNPFDKNVSTKEDIQNMISKNVRDSEGNYDAMLGVVTNFNFSYNQEGGYDCTIKLMSLGILISNTKMNNPRVLPNLQEKIIKRLVNRLIDLERQRLIEERERAEKERNDPAISREAYPPCVRKKGEIVTPGDEKKRLSTSAIQSEVSGVNYFFYPNGQYQTTGYSVKGFYECDGENIIINGQAIGFTNAKYGDILNQYKNNINGIYAGYDDLKALPIYVPGTTNINKLVGTSNLEKKYVSSIELKAGVQGAKESGKYLAFNEFKKFLPTFGLTKYKPKATIKLPFVTYTATTYDTNTFAPQEVNRFQKISNLLVREKVRSGKPGSNAQPIVINSSKNLTVTATSVPDAQKGQYVVEDSVVQYDEYYRSEVTYAFSEAGNIRNFKISLKYDGFAEPLDARTKSYLKSISSFYGEIADTIIQPEIIKQISEETSNWEIINIDASTAEFEIALKKVLNFSLSVKVPPLFSNGTRDLKQPEKNWIVENAPYSLTMFLYIQNDINVIKAIEVPKSEDLVLAADSVGAEQTQQNTNQLPEELSDLPVLDASAIQQSEALKFRSAFEVMVRTIQLYSLDTSIVEGIEQDNIVHTLDMLSSDKELKTGVFADLTKELFSDGLFSDMIVEIAKARQNRGSSTVPPSDFGKKCEAYDKEINTSGTVSDKDLMLSVRTWFGFHFGLLGNRSTATELLVKNLFVNYDYIFRTYTIPYRFNSGVFEGTQLNHPVYMPLGLVMMILNHICLIYDSNNKTKKDRPMFYIDFNNKTNLCLSNTKHLSTNPYEILIPFQGSDKDFESIIEPSVIGYAKNKNGQITSKAFIRGTTENPQPTEIYTPRSPEKGDLISAQLPEFKDTTKSMDNYRGRIMNILVSCDYLLKIVENYSKQNNSADIYVKEFVEQILFDINKSLGDVNTFRFAYDDASNTAYVTDDQFVPHLEDSFIDESNKTELPLFGKGSIARNIEIRSEISSKLANMLAISANSQIDNMSNLSKNADSYGFYNSQYTDRYIPNRTEVTSSITLPTSTMIKSAIQFNNAIQTFYSDATPAMDSVGHATNYYIERMSKIKSEDKGTRASALIPVSLNFSIDGISGIGMGHAFTIPDQFLPYTYNLSLTDPYGNEDKLNTVGFVAVGLDHVIENNQWISSVRANMMYMKKVQDFNFTNKLEKLEASKRAFRSEELFRGPTRFNGKSSSNFQKFISQPGVKEKVETIASEIGITADDLYVVFRAETAGTFDPAIQNRESNATGLIQFLPSTAEGLGTTVDKLKNMSALEQLDYVRSFFLPAKGRLKNAYDAYAWVFFPAIVGKPGGTIIESKTQSAQLISQQNPAVARAAGKKPGDILYVSDFYKYVASQLNV